ncbi:glycosyltransferase [Petropleomorpha daqingensis]|uniref:Glycosyltransferase involved in cell wall biosynthesis n=1 Tax=Petropleomorpha daqingensis TaxID=2026353 RepID=A0A853CDC4_9ACTN|nr:glycosyltransferase [Petropleomorpha daqingensis]NYJ05860.1 glycosyltransferase involved in cell wall biosynthesis [Petropleomorpha daqingensis]
MVNEFSGIGVVQRALYPRLEAMGLELRVSPEREPSGAGLRDRLAALTTALLARPEPGGVYFSTVNPFPLAPGDNAVTLIHDLQWLNTKHGASRLYHALDLRRTVKKSRALLAISERVQRDLLAHFPEDANKITVCRLGPGIVDVPRFEPRASRDIVLMGGAPHKRNELAAEMLADAPESFDKIIGIGVSDRTRAIVEDRVGTDRCIWHYRVPREQVLEILATTYAFILLGVEEGFGLPYIEALASGAHVVAIDQPLTRELLGDAAVLLEDAKSEALAKQWLELQSDLPALQVRQAVASRYSWDDFAAQARAVLTSLPPVT